VTPPGGVTESLLVYAHKVPIEVLVELVNAGLARVRIERLGRPAMEVAHVEILAFGPSKEALISAPRRR
jgi:hypothetical protein